MTMALTGSRGDAAEFAAARGDRSSGWLPQSRSEVLARNGIVATSQPLAAQAGLQILKNGGNAIDAAVATAAVMNVVEPGSAGIGGDVFVIAWLAKENKLVALNGSGRSPSGATPQHLAERGATTAMPSQGIDSATAPGAVDAWDALLKRAGSLSFKELLQPFRADFIGHMHEFVGQYLFTKDANPVLVRKVADDMARASPEVAMASLQALFRYDFGAVLPGIKVHTSPTDASAAGGAVTLSVIVGSDATANPRAPVIYGSCSSCLYRRTRSRSSPLGSGLRTLG